MNQLSDKNPKKEMKTAAHPAQNTTLIETSERGYKRCDDSIKYIKNSKDPSMAAAVLDMVG